LPCQSRWAAWIAAGIACVALACGDDANPTGGSSQGGSGGDTTTSGGGGQGAGGMASGGAPSGGGGAGAGPSGGGGAGGGPPPDPGPPGNALVSAGDRVSSPSYTLVFTMGQSTQNQSKMTSQNYRLHGGLIGSTGNLP